MLPGESPVRVEGGEILSYRDSWECGEAQGAECVFLGAQSRGEGWKGQLPTEGEVYPCCSPESLPPALGSHLNLGGHGDWPPRSLVTATPGRAARLPSDLEKDTVQEGIGEVWLIFSPRCTYLWGTAKSGMQGK